MPTPLPILGTTYRCAFRWGLVGTSQTAVNVMHFVNVTAGNQSPAVFESLSDSVNGNMFDCVDNNAVITQVDIIKLDGTSATQSFTTGSGVAWQGQQPTTGVPQVAALIKLQTGLRGRANRGRVYLPFVAEGAMVHGLITGSIITAMTTAWAAFYAGIEADPDLPLTPVVASYDRAHGGVGAISHAVTTFLVEAETGTQRRRQGRNR
jgi:hypothetical protein